MWGTIRLNYRSGPPALCVLVVITWPRHYQPNHGNRAQEIAEPGLMFFFGDQVSVHDMSDESKPFLARIRVFPDFIRDTHGARELVDLKRGGIWSNVFSVRKLRLGVLRFVGEFPVVGDKSKIAIHGGNFGGDTPLVFPEKQHVGLFSGQMPLRSRTVLQKSTSVQRS